MNNLSIISQALNQIHNSDCIEVTLSPFSLLLPYINGLFSAIRAEKAYPVGMRYFEDYSIHNARILITLEIEDSNGRPYTVYLSSDLELRGTFISYRNSGIHRDQDFYYKESELNLSLDKKFERLEEFFKGFVGDSVKKFGESVNKSSK
jgi:hypothetical protein